MPLLPATRRRQHQHQHHDQHGSTNRRRSGDRDAGLRLMLSQAPRRSLPSVPPPMVSARAWAVLDCDTNRLIGGHRANDAMAVASLTKLITAAVVMQLAQVTASLLEQQAHVSPAAAAMPGTRAELRTGDQVNIRDLLYGMLLASGNDAAMALVEHLKLDTSTEGPSRVDQFAARMNRAASEFGATHSKFSDPHGSLDSDHHFSTAGDIAKCVAAALRIPGFQGLVTAAKHTGVIRRRLPGDTTDSTLHIEWSRRQHGCIQNAGSIGLTPIKTLSGYQSTSRALSLQSGNKTEQDFSDCGARMQVCSNEVL